MKTVRYFLVLFIFFNQLTFTSCTSDDSEEDLLSITTENVVAEGGEETPPEGKGG